MSRILAAWVAFFAVAIAASPVLHAQACKSNPLPPRYDWPVYGGQPEGDHYSSLSQINRGNVHKLKEAWKFDAAEEGGLETSPIIIGRTLFAYTASQKVIALDASTGKLLWKFDSGRAQQATVPWSRLLDGRPAWSSLSRRNALSLRARCTNRQSHSLIWRARKNRSAQRSARRLPYSVRRPHQSRDGLPGFDHRRWSQS